MAALIETMPGRSGGAVRILRRLTKELAALERELNSLQERFAHMDGREGVYGEIVAQHMRTLMGDLRLQIADLADVQSCHAPPSAKLLANLSQISAALALLKKGAAAGAPAIEADRYVEV